MTNIESVLKSRDITLPTKVSKSQGYDFPSGQAWLWELDHKEDNAKEQMLSSYGSGEDSSKSLGLQGEQTSQS